ncbi:MAG: polysaccharide biosynthesis protein [Thermoleophilaceae bacterium]
MLVDHAENNLFEIRRELEEEQHFGSLAAVLADCKDATRMQELFADEEPSVVFHAAAYKHVGLMEENPVEAVRNNAVATRIVAAAAGEAGVERFVLVSTDKAVAPATVMGASKALAEWAVEAAQNRYRSTRYASVRFGNVLGSSGSVVPIFRRQIEAGGPVTVTDAEMTRYFMTIPEAVQLIIRAADLVPIPSGARRRGAAKPRAPRISGRPPSPAARPDVRARDGRPRQDRGAGPQHDPAVGQGARRGHRDRDRGPPARGEDPRGAVRARRAPGADARRADRGRRTPAAGSRMGGDGLRADRGSGLQRRRRRPGRRGGPDVGGAGADDVPGHPGRPRLGPDRPRTG